MYFTLTLVCGLVAIAWVFITGEGIDMIRKTIKKEIQTTISAEGERMKAQLQREFSRAEMQRMQGQYERYVR